VNKANANILSLFLILSLASCNLSGNAAPQSIKTAQPVTPEPATATPTAMPEPVPTGYTDLLQNKIDSGEWTLEKGLVTLLKTFAGELQVSQAGLGEGVLETEGTGILQMAGEYLQTGTDQAARDEIARLLNIIVPTQETLERYSIPEEQAFGSNPKLAAPARQVLEKCETLWADGFPLESTTTTKFPCFLFHGDGIGLDRFWLYYPMAWQGDDSKIEYYTATMGAAIASITEFQKYDSVHSIYFVFTTLNQDAEGLDMAVETFYRSFRPGTETCPVIIYPSALTMDKDDYMQSIAHAVFHCFQARNLHDQLLGTGIHQEQKWWSEGTAEYFSNLVYPEVNYEHRFAARFSSLSTHIPLTYMSHENFAFFQFMGDRIGAEGVIALLHSMPTTPTFSAQTAALAAVPGIEAAFEDFVRTILDKTLYDSDTTLIPLPIRYTEEYPFTDITSKVFSSQLPFVISRYRVIFAGEREYELFIESNYAANELGARREGAPGLWEQIPNRVGGCDELAYLLYVITTAPDLEVTETITTTMITEAFCDRCLIGRWEATNDSMKAYMQSAGVAGEAAGPEIRMVLGRMLMRFDGIGIGSSTYDNLSVSEVRAGDIEGVAVIVMLAGSAIGRYSADGSELIAFTDTSNIRLSVEIFLNGGSLGESVNTLDPEDLLIRPGIPTRYTCEGDTLTTWPPVEGVTVEPIVWVRASP